MSNNFPVLFVNSLLSDKFNLSFENMVLRRKSYSFIVTAWFTMSFSYKVRTDAELALNKNNSEKVYELSSKNNARERLNQTREVPKIEIKILK